MTIIPEGWVLAYEAWLRTPQAASATDVGPEDIGYNWFERSCANSFRAGYEAAMLASAPPAPGGFSSDVAPASLPVSEGRHTTRHFTADRDARGFVSGWDWYDGPLWGGCAAEDGSEWVYAYAGEPDGWWRRFVVVPRIPGILSTRELIDRATEAWFWDLHDKLERAPIPQCGAEYAGEGLIVPSESPVEGLGADGGETAKRRDEPLTPSPSLADKGLPTTTDEADRQLLRALMLRLTVGDLTDPGTMGDVDESVALFTEPDKWPFYRAKVTAAVDAFVEARAARALSGD